jgi:superfamily I DNA and/or RNA helicase
MKQVFNCYKTSHGLPQTRFLALTPSNLAADQLIERLSDVFAPSLMVRYNSYRRSVESMSRCVQEYSKIDYETRLCKLMSKHEVMRYSVVVTTCISAGLLHAMGIPCGHFTSIFVDEAGQATEPEFWIGVSTLLHPDPRKSQLVLAGDPKQLGPILRSPIAKRFGLEKSFLERLIELPAYSLTPQSAALTTENDKAFASREILESQHHRNPNMVQRLARNYRSHPHILAIYSSLFYRGELIPEADVGMRDSFLDWDGLPCKGFPIVFQGVQGRDEREGDSPSWYNADEIVSIAMVA